MAWTRADFIFYLQALVLSLFGAKMDKEEQLRNITKYKRPRVACSKLGDVLNKFVDEGVSVRYKRFSKVSEVWDEMLPDELARHCKLDGIDGGVLRVVVDKPSYRYELETCKHEILKRMNQEQPGIKIKEIKAAIV